MTGGIIGGGRGGVHLPDEVVETVHFVLYANEVAHRFPETGPHDRFEERLGRRDRAGPGAGPSAGVG